MKKKNWRERLCSSYAAQSVPGSGGVSSGEGGYKISIWWGALVLSASFVASGYRQITGCPLMAWHYDVCILCCRLGHTYYDVVRFSGMVMAVCLPGCDDAAICTP